MATRKIKSFTTATEAAPAEPIVFQFTEDGEEFEAYAEVSGAVTLELVASAGSDDPSETAAGILAYLKGSMDASTYRRFNKFVKDPANNIKIETLSEVVAYLVEERTSRPTAAS